MRSKHPSADMPDDLLTDRGSYKAYEFDTSLPVPKRTKIRHQSRADHKPRDPPVETVTQQSEDLYEPSNEGPESNSSLTTDGTIISSQDKCSAVLTYISKMRLTGTASDQLIRLLNICGSVDLSKEDVKQTVNDAHVETIDYCELCSCLFPEDKDIFHCVSPICSGLRFLGPAEHQHLKRSKSYFATSSIHSQILDIMERNKLVNNGITLTMNTDGVPLYHSLAVSLWPVFLVLNELRPSERFLMKNVIVWGIWQGRGKPVFRTFLKPLTTELNSLHHNGIMLDGKRVDVTLTCVTMDLQAKSQVMEMVPHNGQCSCVTCEIEGVVEKKGKGHTKAFPVSDPCPLRTSCSILKNAEEAILTGKAQKGIKDVSVLFDVDHFNPVHGVVPDYMHGVLLGTTRKLLTLWTGKTSKGQPYYIGGQVKEVDRRLSDMRPTDNMSRLPRSINDHLSHWKASEFQHWLLFYSVPCLQGILPPQYMENLCYLVEGVFKLLGENLENEVIDEAELSLTKFQITFENMYGVEHCGLNIHNIGFHIANYARLHGPLWGWSCFSFEDMNGTLLKSAHGTGNVCRQLLQTMLVQKKLHGEAAAIQDDNLRDFALDMLTTGRRTKTKKECENCSLLGKMHPVDVQNLQVEQEVKQYTGKDVCSLQKVHRIKLKGQLISSKNYKRMQKRNCHTVLLDNGCIKSIEFFVYDAVSNKCFALTQDLKVTGLLHNSLTHLIKVEHGRKNEIVPVNAFVEKVICLEGFKDCVCMARLPTFYNHCVYM
ncbi:hypothetical protein DPMN_189913 [Dreissena polymorpha]|uniref:Uncharacterized protein n=2 Tax=Dreissena polymorpha TaxID=45954 RepID=A0A9D4DUE6_DREPO|nr:hypothetical protein DPMN_189913 [Dreissena polymorpha]